MNLDMGAWWSDILQGPGGCCQDPGFSSVWNGQRGLLQSFEKSKCDFTEVVMGLLWLPEWRLDSKSIGWSRESSWKLSQESREKMMVIWTRVEVVERW